MPSDPDKRLLVAMTGASGAYAVELLLDRSPWPVVLVASDWGRQVYAHERGAFERMQKKAVQVFDNSDMLAPPASGSVLFVGMVIMPCSANTLGQIAAGLGDTLITRAAHCHLKERRPLVLGLRETPLTYIDLQNAVKIAAAGATVMPISPPFFMCGDCDPQQVSMHELLAAYVDRVLALLGHSLATTWEDLRLQKPKGS